MAEKSLILRIKADAADAKKGLAEVREGLSGLFDGASGAGGRILGGAAQAFGGLKGMVGTIGPQVEALITAAEKAVELAEFAGERQRLQENVSGQVLANLRTASRGLVDDMTLMRVAAKAATGDFALTSNQMAIVAEAAVVLHERGLGPVHEILQRITDSLRKGEIEALKEYGIVITGAKSKAEGFHTALTKLAEQNAAAESSMRSTANVGDFVSEKMVVLKNAIDSVKTALGYLVAGFVTVGEAVADFGEAIGETLGKLYVGEIKHAEGVRMATEEENRAYWAKRRLNQQMEEQRKALEKLVELEQRKADSDAIARRQDPSMKKEAEAARATHAVRRSMQETESRILEIQNERTARVRDELELFRELHGIRSGRVTPVIPLDQSPDPIGVDAEEARRALEKAQESKEWFAGIQSDTLEMAEEARRAAAEAEKRDPYRHLRDSASAYEQSLISLRAGLEGLAQAGGEAFAMLISGQEGAADAAKDAVIGFLRAEAARSAALALQSTALGLYKLAMWDIPAATSAFAAAATFAAFAAAYGAGAAIAGPTSGERRAAAEERDRERDSRTNNTGRQSMSGGGPTVVNNVYNLSGFFGDERQLMRKLSEAQRKAELDGAVQPARSGASRRAA